MGSFPPESPKRGWTWLRAPFVAGDSPVRPAGANGCIKQLHKIHHLIIPHFSQFCTCPAQVFGRAQKSPEAAASGLCGVYWGFAGLPFPLTGSGGKPFALTAAAAAHSGAAGWPGPAWPGRTAPGRSSWCSSSSLWPCRCRGCGCWQPRGSQRQHPGC